MILDEETSGAPVENIPQSSLATVNEQPRTSRRPRRSKRCKTLVKIDKTEFHLDWQQAHAEFRKYFVKAALELHLGNIVHTAKALGIARRTLQIQMRAAGLETTPTRSK